MPPTQTQNRKDLLQAYRLMTTRTSLALIAGEPDSPNQPLRRRSTATVSGILIALIVCVLFGILGSMHVLGMSEKNLAHSGGLVLDKDTGTPYVSCNTNELCPALNYTSALLALAGTGKPSTTSVSQQQLAGTKLGPTIGIAGLPQDLPTEANLVKGPWAVCDNGAGVSTLVGGKSVGGSPLSGSSAGLVQSGGQEYVLVNGEKMAVSATYAGAVANGTQARPVTAAWLNAVPSGAPFAPPAIQDFGATGHDVTVGGRIGQVFTENTPSGQSSFVMEQDGKLHPVNKVQATLLVDEPHAPPASQVTPSEATANQGSAVPLNGLPATMPKATVLSGTTCFTYSGGKQAISMGATVPVNATSTGRSGPNALNQVWLPGGGGALIGMTPSPGSKSVSSWTLLAGATRYGLNGSTVAAMLGYDLGSDQTLLPSSLVSAIPPGAGLDPTAAKKPAAG